MLTLPLRIPLALLAAPFAMHNKPPMDVLVAVGLAGFSIFGLINKDAGATKDALTKMADTSGQLTALLREDLTPDPRNEMGEREAEVDDETRIRFIELFWEHWFGSVLNMTGLNGADSVIRLNAAMYNYQSRVTPLRPIKSRKASWTKQWMIIKKAYGESPAKLREKYGLP